jgi:xyloglucan-specific exo-beta-1,4-glucanase
MKKNRQGFSAFRARHCAWLLLVGFLFFIHVSVYAQSESYNWKSVAIGGGGFVSAIITSKTQSGLIYARTDVGGAYRWDAANSRWIPLLDWVSDDEVGYLGVESIAIDPSTPSRVYMFVGISYFNNGRTAILRSTDYGNTFSVTEVTSQFKAHGNGMGRQNGEKLIVDPNNGNILYCGTRWNGIFKSTNGGVNWSRLSGLDVTTTPNENGVSFVVADGSSVSGGATQRLFAGISRTGSNFYRSDNGGQTFTAISGGPTSLMPQRAVLASDGNLYITYANGAGPSGHWSLPEPSDTGQIWKYNVASGSWTNVTPSGVTYAFGGISVDPGNPSRLIASTINTWTSQGGAWGDRFYLSTNGGASWTDVVSRGFSMDPNGITWISGKAIHWTGSIEFDPFNTQKVFVTSGNGIFVNENINATAGVWKFSVTGLEETVPLGLVSIPNGPTVSVIGDYDGFAHSNPSQYAPIHSPSIGTTTGLALGGNKLLRVGSAMYYSTNQGTSWTQCTINGTKGQVAVSSDGNNFLHCPESSSTTHRSTNNGSSWSTVSGLSISEARPVADPVNAGKFYAYNPSNGAVLVSTNGGSNFSSSGSTASGGSKVIRLAPGREGHIWVPLNGGGLSRSTNSGQSFSTVSGVTYCGAVGFGKEASGSSYPAIYIWGTVNGVRGAYRSTNEGATWVRVNDNAHEYGGPGNGQFIAGDMNVYGRVYMSTAGRGIVYGEAGGCTPTGITPYMQFNGTWQQANSASVASGSTVILGPQPTSGGSWSWSGMASGTTREVTLNPTSSGTATATYTNSSGCQSTQVFTITVSGGSTTSYVTIANRATGLLIDGMGRTSAGSNCGQYASSGSWNQMWTLETSGAYVYIKNRNTGLYIDGRGNSTDGAYAGQWSNSTSNNLQWQQETTGGYVKFKNRATGLYLDGMGRTVNGEDVGQWSNSTSNNQQWTINNLSSVTNVSSSGHSTFPNDVEVLSIEELGSEVSLSPNPFTTGIKISVPDPKAIKSIVMIDMTGKKVEVIEHEDIKTEQTMGSRLNPGLYVVEVNGFRSRKSFKVFKK